MKVFAWKLAHNGLATQANKTAQNMERKSTCLLCGGDEDAHHAVLMCPHARMLRSAMREFWELPDEQELIHAGFEWLLRVVDNNDPEIMGKLMLILWRCWFVRNELTHSARKLSIEASVGFLLNYWDTLFTIRQAPGCNTQVLIH